MPETMLVTGSRGFIGSCFVLKQMKPYLQIRLINLDALTDAGNSDNVNEAAGDLRYTFVQADVAIRAAVEAVHPTLAVQFAKESHVDRSIDGPRDLPDSSALMQHVCLGYHLHLSHKLPIQTETLLFGESAGPHA